jgi:hypothetical protein
MGLRYILEEEMRRAGFWFVCHRVAWDRKWLMHGRRHHTVEDDLLAQLLGIKLARCHTDHLPLRENPLFPKHRSEPLWQNLYCRNLPK